MTERTVAEWVGKRPESMPGTLVLLRLYSRQNGLCACGCGHVMSFERDRIDRDHVVALKDGGENREANLQLLLRECHLAKTIGENVARGEANRHKAKAFTRPKRSGFRKAEPQRTATRAIVRKADRRSQEETS
jgi:5-methylcytosine-specific restriction protein A